MNISNDDLYIRSFYGKNPNCVAILAMGENYENSGFKIKYKVVEKVEDLDDVNNLNSGTWIIGNVVSNLSDTNVIIAKLTDSNGNEQEDYSAFYLKGYSEEFSEIYSKTDYDVIIVVTCVEKFNFSTKKSKLHLLLYKHPLYNVMCDAT